MASDILVKIGADISDFSRKMAQSNKALSNFSRANQQTFGAFKQVGGMLTKYVTAPAAAATTALTGITLVKGFQRLAGIDTARAKLGALGHDAESVEQIMTNALDSVRGTAFGLDEAATAAASAVAAGIQPGKELEKYLSLAGDAAAIAGTDFNEMGSIFGKVQTAQRAYTMELNQLADRGIPIYQWLADAAGVSTDAVRDMASNGEISAEMFRDAIEKNIGGAAKEIGEESFVAALKNIGADIARIGASFLDAGGEGEGFFSRLKPLLTEFRGFLQSLEEPAVRLGEKFGDAFIKVIETLRNLKEWFDGLSPAVQKIVTTAGVLGSVFAVISGPILLLIGYIPQIVAGFKAIRTVIAAVRTAMLAANTVFLANPIVLIVTVIVAAIAGLVYLIYKYWDEIKAFTIAAWGAIADFFSSLWSSIKDIAINVWESVSKFFVGLWQSIKNVATATWDALVSAVMAIVQPFINGVTNIFNGMKDGLQKILDGLKQYFGGVWDLIKNIFLGAVLLLINLVTGNFEELRSNAKAIFENIREALRNIWEGIKKVFGGALEAIWGAVKAAWNNIVTNTRATFDAAKRLISTIWNGIKTFFTQTLVNIWATVRQKFTDMVNAVRDRMNDVKSRIESGWERARSFLTGINLLQIGKNVIQGLINGIKSKISAVADAVKSVADNITGKIKSILKISSPSRLLIQFGRWTTEGLAEGIEDAVGLVSRATEKIAEAATPEAPAISLAYDTPSGIRSNLASAVSGTVDVNTRDEALATSIASLERRLTNLAVIMDERVVGRIVEPYVTKEQESNEYWRRRGAGNR